MDRTTILLISTAARGLDADVELSRVQRSIERTRFRDQLELVIDHCVDLDELGRLLVRHDPVLLHVSGHGTAPGALTFPGPGTTRIAVEIGTLEALFAEFPRLRYVVLNACETAPLAEALAENRDVVVGMAGVVDSARASQFSAVFYSTLAEGGSLALAFGLAVAVSECEAATLHSHRAVAPRRLHLTQPSRFVPRGEVTQLLESWLERCRSLQAGLGTEFDQTQRKLWIIDGAILAVSIALWIGLAVSATQGIRWELILVIATLLLLVPTTRRSRVYRRLDGQRQTLGIGYRKCTLTSLELERLLRSDSQLDKTELERIATRLEGLADSPLLVTNKGERVFLGARAELELTSERIP